MSNDFQINTKIQTGNFNNSINEFNKAFNKSNKTSLNQIQDGTNFEEIFNSISKDPLQAGAQIDAFNLDLKANSKNNLSSPKNLAGTISDGLLNSLSELSQINKQADSDLETFASGGDISVHDVMISTQKSTLAMNLAIQLRNQAMNAYNELKNMSM